MLIRPGHPPIDLNSEVSTIQGWLVSATGISNDGRILVNARLPEPGGAAGATFGRPYVLTPA